LAYDYKLASLAMEMMMTAYGAEAGNVCLKFLPYGGNGRSDACAGWRR
jgi:glucokinase